jgi:cytochrome c5
MSRATTEDLTMTPRLLIGALLALASASTFAQSFGAPAPDTGAGKKRAAVCFACHGERGISSLPGTPHLAGQDRSYLEKALHAYRLGETRTDPTMTAMAKPLSDADIINIAAYFSMQPPMRQRVMAPPAPTSRPAAPAPATPVATARPAPSAPSTPAVTAAAKPVLASKPTAVAVDGKAVYDAHCFACHGTGAAGAPKPGDRAAWAPRIALGNAALLQNAIKGINAMPPKGACGSCSDNDLKAAVDWMVAQSK